MSQFFDPAAAAAFNPDKATKADIVRGAALFVGLNCRSRVNPRRCTPLGADKFYLVLSGNARMIVGGETREAAAGTLVWAPADVPHGVEAAHERTVMLIGIAPPQR